MARKVRKSEAKLGPNQERRTFHFGITHGLNEHSHFKTNFIRTSKYTLLTFLPKSILIQFNRYANFFFLLTAIVQSIPTVSPLTPFSAIAPFVFVIFLSVVREGYEDFLRHKSDKELNSSPCEIYRNGQFSRFKWRDIRVGEIIRVKEGEFLPADLVLLNASNEHSIAYIETSSLDGEKNLKTKTTLKELVGLTENGEPTKTCEGSLSCDHPNALLHRFEGYIELQSGKKIMLGPKNFLYRGAKLKNTEWAIGIVVYTGEDTKVMKNAEVSHVKQSYIEKSINTGILVLLLTLILFCLLTATASYIWNALYLDSSDVHQIVYLSKTHSNGVEAIINFFAYFILINTMIPISLIVTLEFVKLFQSFFINKDVDMYNEENQRFAHVSDTTIIEELGKVEYVFTDKTGTLTCNKMEFKLCVIGNKLYGDKSILNPQGLNVSATLQKRDSITNVNEGIDYSFDDRGLNADLHGESDVRISVEFHGTDIVTPVTSQKALINEFMQCISLCHDCVVEKDANEGIQFQGPSPDEVTLVDFARRNSYIFKGTQQGVRVVEIDGKDSKFELLQLFEFDSDRKRMSVIVREQSGVIKLYTKGADTVIKSRLSKDIHQKFLHKIDHYTDSFSLKGLRTLLVGMRVITEEEYADIRSKMDAVIEAVDREDKIKEIADAIEVNLTLIGCTGVEDKLQDQVPETIRDLLRAGIKVWMLTGDKLETAENIARSCNLIHRNFEVFRISEKTHEEIDKNLKSILASFPSLLQKNVSKAILVEGEALTVIFENADLKKEFFEISRNCESVVCCRVNPKQKAEVVRLIKNGLQKITLAIGDGANDVNMIQAAHIGVGLYGQEGMRAVQAADFAIPEFKALWRLLFVHGRWCYIRIAEMVLYFFYKNMVFTLPLFYFAFISAFSGQNLYDSWYISLYNTIFTLLPVVVRACFDQDVYYKKKVYENAEGKKMLQIVELTNVRKSYPLLYAEGVDGKAFTLQKFFLAVIQGAIHSVIIFVLTYFSLDREIININGTAGDLWFFSITIFTTVIFVVDLKIAIYTRYWTALMWIALLVTSLGAYIGFVWVYDSLDYYPISRTAFVVFTSPHFYLIVLLNLTIVLLLDTMRIYIKKEYYTEAADYIVSLVKSKSVNDEAKFERVEEEILERRKRRSLKKQARSKKRRFGKGKNERKSSISQIQMTTPEHKKEATVINIELGQASNNQGDIVIETRHERTPQKRLSKKMSSRIEDQDPIQIEQHINSINDSINKKIGSVSDKDLPQIVVDLEKEMSNRIENHGPIETKQYIISINDSNNKKIGCASDKELPQIEMSLEMEDIGRNDTEQVQSRNDTERMHSRNDTEQVLSRKDTERMQSRKDSERVQSRNDTPRITSNKSVPEETHNIHELINTFVNVKPKSISYVRH